MAYQKRSCVTRLILPDEGLASWFFILLLSLPTWSGDPSAFDVRSRVLVTCGGIVVRADMDASNPGMSRPLKVRDPVST